MLFKVRKALVDIVQSKARLEAQIATVKGKLPRLEDQARQAIIGNRDDLARLILRRHQVAAAELHMLDEQMRQVQHDEQQLSLSEQKLSTQIETFLARQEVIAARYGGADAQVRINEALGGVSQELTELGTTLKAAEARAGNIQARASTLDRLIDEGVLDQSGLPADIRLNVQAVEDRLAAIKQEIINGKSSPTS